MIATATATATAAEDSHNDISTRRWQKTMKTNATACFQKSEAAAVDYNGLAATSTGL